MNRQSFSAVLLVVGMLTLLFAATAPNGWFGGADWNQEDAVAYQSAAAELHSRSLAQRDDRESAQLLRESREKMGDLDSRLNSAEEGLKARRAVVRWLGYGFCLLGVGLASIKHRG